MNVLVPLTFWLDHADRSPCDDESEMCIEVERKGNRMLIECNAIQLENLRSDAAFYCHRDGPDECPPAIKASARATLNAIAKQVTA